MSQRSRDGDVFLGPFGRKDVRHAFAALMLRLGLIIGLTNFLVPLASAQPTEQPVVTYLHAQLDAFANGTRRNDIGQQMRNVARGMTPAEITAASQFYGGSP